jgi:predicted O-methyltransferase YrrM
MIKGFKMQRVALYGTGNFAKRFHETLSNVKDIKFFIDEYFDGTLLGLDVYKSINLTQDMINGIDMIYICIEDTNIQSLAKDRLLQAGIHEDKICHDFTTDKMMYIYLYNYLTDNDENRVNELLNDPSIDMQGWFGIENQISIKRSLEQVAHEGMRVLEIGSHKGVSSSVIAKIVQKYNGTLICVDPWDTEEIFLTHIKNMRRFGFSNNIKYMRMYSTEAAELIKDNQQFDLIFIDGAHDYDTVCADIRGFLPKIRKNGIICGDDCQYYYKELPSEFVEKYKDQDPAAIEDGIPQYCHCGVIKGLDDCFGEDFTLDKNPNYYCSFWWKVVD